ncbi:MAG TPA: hypothetical protein VGU61_11665 [Noviherbaspirillum sp.]|nr:hypothetical protein [Noviherbaspirillum sp.]
MLSIIRIRLFIVIATLAITLPIAAKNIPPEQKVFSNKERRAEEIRIQKKIEEGLDWRNRTKETLDEYDDEHRLLYGMLNESILLRTATGERFGIYESISEETNARRLEIRLHKKNKLTDRFLSSSVYCGSAALSADQVAPTFVLFREVCYQNGRAGHTLYLFDYKSRNLYWLYSNEVIYEKKPSVTFRNGMYRVRWQVKTTEGKISIPVVKNFSVEKAAGNTWKVKTYPPINDEAGDIEAEEKLGLDKKFDLPSFVANWGK